MAFKPRRLTRIAGGQPFLYDQNVDFRYNMYYLASLENPRKKFLEQSGRVPLLRQAWLQTK